MLKRAGELFPQRMPDFVIFPSTLSQQVNFAKNTERIASLTRLVVANVFLIVQSLCDCNLRINKFFLVWKLFGSSTMAWAPAQVSGQAKFCNQPLHSLYWTGLTTTSPGTWTALA